MLKKNKLEFYEYLRKTFDVFFILILIILLLIGFIGQSNFKIDQSSFELSLVSRNFSKTPIEINNLDKFKKNKNFLSSDQINNKKIVLEWSKKIMYNVQNDLAIPRMYFPYIPKNISEFQSTIKKDVFLSILLPIALRGNELVLLERKLMKVAFLSSNIYQIENLAKKYKVKDFKKINFSDLTTSDLNRIKEELLTKINKIPISMILAQSIIESGWGSSRFAQEGNALFGEWTWKTNVGIKPKGNMDANFAVKNFKNLLESLNSYILNLNSHPAYFEMRRYRALKNKTGKKITGYDTANFIEKDAEIGTKYITKVTNIIKSNNLSRFENSNLELYLN